MCRYAFKTYKSHFACFNCRKTFKQAPYADLLKAIGKSDHYEKLRHKPIRQLTDKEASVLAEIDTTYKNREIKCPQCGGYMADLGLDFKSPKQSAAKQWRIVEGLCTIGKSFYSCGCNGIGYIPQSHKDYKMYLQNVLAGYQEQIAYYQNKTLSELPDKAERITYWSERVQTINTEINKYMNEE